MEHEIKYGKTVTFQGRNGNFKQAGIRIWRGSNKEVWLEPVTGKGGIGNCWIQIPPENVDAVVKALQGV